MRDPIFYLSNPCLDRPYTIDSDINESRRCLPKNSRNKYVTV